MLNDALLTRIYDHPEVYRPSQELNSLLLELTWGCSYGKCAFCDFPNDGFRCYSLDQVEDKLRHLQQANPSLTRMFFLGCDPFGLPTAFLLKVMRMVKSYLPRIENFSMYARAVQVLKKSAEELDLLRQNGLTDLHIGLESGSDAVLRLHNKGETAEEIMSALLYLEQRGLGYHLSFIPGLGGRDLCIEHAEKSAAFLSAVHPITVWCTGLVIWDKTPLKAMVEQGLFKPLTYREMMVEERYMLELTNMTRPCFYVDSTALGKCTVMAKLPDGKEELLRNIDGLLAKEAED